MSAGDLWTLRRDAPRMSPWDADLVGFHVHGLDGPLGIVVATSGERGRSYVVADTGQWLLGRHVLIPGQFIRDVDHSSETLYVLLRREEVRGAPAYDAPAGLDEHLPVADAYYAALAARPGPAAGHLDRDPGPGAAP